MWTRGLWPPWESAPGPGLAQTVAALLKVPLVEVSHQQGHLAAALWSAGRQELFASPFLAWHLSGGTTELLYTQPHGWNLDCSRIGGTTDISAGQLIDRTGQLLELPFPAGKALDRLSQEAGAVEGYRVKCPEMEFSLSGVENQVQQYLARTGCREETAAFALASVCRAVEAATGHARQRYPGLPVVFSGGVASNSMLRAYMKPYDPVFCPPQYATDNAMGVAVLTWRSLEESNGTADL